MKRNRSRALITGRETAAFVFQSLKRSRFTYVALAFDSVARDHHVSSKSDCRCSKRRFLWFVVFLYSCCRCSLHAVLKSDCTSGTFRQHCGGVFGIWIVWSLTAWNLESTLILLSSTFVACQGQTADALRQVCCYRLGAGRVEPRADPGSDCPRRITRLN